MDAVSAARRSAFEILMAVENGRSHSDDLLRGRGVSALAAADRNLATALVLGVLRWQMVLDEAVRPLLKRPGAKLDNAVRIALRMGAFQLLHMDRIPARAAIDESVELTKQAGHRFAAGMVNAVLRRLAEDDARNKTPDGNQAERAHPAWMVDRWTAHYGAEAARAICMHGQAQPRTSIRVTDAETERELTAAGVELRPGELLTAARTVTAGDVTETAAFCEGRVRLQDEGSQLVAEMVARGSDLLDCCAAPGGKTLVLAERNAEARIVACEASEQRLEQMRKRLAGLGGRVECRLADASAIAEADAFDAALADVPCSGTGTLGRNPEIRHRLKVEDLDRQAERQRAILSAAVRALRPGGQVVYSTCSLEPEENEQVVAAVLEQAANARSVPLEGRMDALQNEGVLTAEGAARLRACVTREGYLRLLPGVLHTDGFFIAAMERTA